MATLIANEIEQARQYFAETRRRVVAATSGLSEAQWRFKTAPERWSIQEIVEHMAIVHGRVLTRIMEQLPQGAAPEPGRDSQMLDALVREKIPDRSIRANGPAFIHPTGKAAPEESLERIFAGYERLIELLESRTDLREHILDSPPLNVVTQGAYTTMDGYQWALTAAAHDQRHVRQIEEVKASPGYPA